MQITSYLFDEYFISFGFRDECLHCALLGNGCNGVHADPKFWNGETTQFWCAYQRENYLDVPNGNASEVLKKIKKRYYHQTEVNARGGKNFRKF